MVHSGPGRAASDPEATTGSSFALGPGATISGLSAPLPGREADRLRALYELDVLDTEAEDRFDRVTRLAAHILDVPIALVSLVDVDRQWFKSRVGLEAVQTPREHAFCAHAILDDEVMVVGDATQDPRFAGNPLVVAAPDIRFYAGAPLIVGDDLRVGTLCVIDREPREVSEAQRRALEDLAKVVVDELDLRRKNAEQRELNLALSHFTHLAAHDLRAPLKSLVNLCDLAMEADDPSRFVEHARRTAASAESVVASYFELAQLRTVEPAVRPVALAAALESGVGGTAPGWVRLDEATVHADPVLLGQLLANVVRNAEQHGRGGLHISVDSGTRRDTIVCRNPIADADLELDDSVFEPFRRRSERGSGAGLGLAIVAGIAKLHGGAVRASVEDGDFTLRVELPRWSKLERGAP